MARVAVRLFLVLVILQVHRGLTAPGADRLVLGHYADGLGSGGICECIGAPAWPGSWEHAKVVFSGKVVRGPVTSTRILSPTSRGAIAVPGSPASLQDQLDARLGEANATLFEVDHVWKAGAAEPALSRDAVVAVQGPFCPRYFELGMRYLVLASQEADATTEVVPSNAALLTNACVPSRPWRAHDELLLRLGLGDPPGPPLMVPSQLRRPGAVIIVLLGVLWIAPLRKRS